MRPETPNHSLQRTAPRVLIVGFIAAVASTVTLLTTNVLAEPADDQSLKHLYEYLASAQNVTYSVLNNEASASTTLSEILSELPGTLDRQVDIKRFSAAFRDATIEPKQAPTEKVQLALAFVIDGRFRFEVRADGTIIVQDGRGFHPTRNAKPDVSFFTRIVLILDRVY